jgi:archaellum biogenesis protein FlaJ (TadC family)
MVMVMVTMLVMVVAEQQNGTEVNIVRKCTLLDGYIDTCKLAYSRTYTHIDPCKHKHTMHGVADAELQRMAMIVVVIVLVVMVMVMVMMSLMSSCFMK